MRMGGSGGLAAPTAVVSTSRGVQIYIKVTDIDIKTEAFTMVLMVGVVEEIVITKEGVEWRETCWELPKGRGESTALDGLGSGEQEWSWRPAGPDSCCRSSISVVEQFQLTPRRLGSMETLEFFFICLAKELDIFYVIEFNCSSLGRVQLKLQFLL